MLKVVSSLRESDDELKEEDPRLCLPLDLQDSLQAGIVALLEKCNRRLRKDADYWRAKYQESLNDSIKHGDAMMGNLLKGMLHKP